MAASRSSDPAGLPFAAAELAAVDDAAARVAGGAELDGPGHRAVADPALEPIGQVARVVPSAEAEADGIAVQHAADWALELGRALVAGMLAAMLFERQAVAHAAVPKIDPHFPIAGNRDGRRARRVRFRPHRPPQCREHGVANLGGPALLELEGIDRD